MIWRLTESSLITEFSGRALGKGAGAPGLKLNRMWRNSPLLPSLGREAESSDSFRAELHNTNPTHLRGGGLNSAGGCPACHKETRENL